MCYSNFIEEKLGNKYVESKGTEFTKSYEESGPATPIFFILSPGVDPLKDVEALGKKLGFTGDNGNFHNISLGQGQEIVAEQAMDLAAAEGHWVVLQVGADSVGHCLNSETWCSKLAHEWVCFLHFSILS